MMKIEPQILQKQKIEQNAVISRQHPSNNKAIISVHNFQALLGGGNYQSI
jgi:hypothetical protein